MTVVRMSGWLLLAMMGMSSAVLAQPSSEAALLRRLDSNRNGMLESAEIPAQARGQIARLAREARLDLNEPLPINRIERQLRRAGGGDDDDDRNARGREDRAGRRRGNDGDEGGRGRDRSGGGRWEGGPWGGGPWGERREGGGGDWRGRRGMDSRANDEPRRGRDESSGRDGRSTGGDAGSTVATLDPKFEFGPGDGARVRGFGPADVVAPPLEEQYDERTLRFVDRILSRSDRNENGRLESNEWDGMRFMGNPQEADLNRDGLLTRDELASQIANRFSQQRSDEGGERGRWEGRPPFGGPGGFSFLWGPGAASGDGRGDERRFGRGRGEGGEERFARGPRTDEEGEGRFGRRFGRGGDENGNDEEGGGRRRGGRGFGWPGGDQGDPTERVRFFAQRMLGQNDRNQNGKLEREEWSQMRGRYADADKNNDSVITLDELVEHMSNATRGGSPGWGPRPEARGDERGNDGSRGRRGGRGEDDRSNEAEKKSYRFMSPAERIESILSGRDRDWFLDHDTNDDGQIAMSEFADSWTNDKIKEFAELDTNSDGLLTPQEYLRTRSD